MNYKKGTQTRGCMKSVMRYVSQTSKTLWDGQQLVSGIGCQPETAFDEFLSTKLLHHKDGGVMFYHMVQSFPKGADIDPRTAHEAARQLAGYFEGCEVLVCTHVDREHIHSHCIINGCKAESDSIGNQRISAVCVKPGDETGQFYSSFQSLKTDDLYLLDYHRQLPCSLQYRPGGIPYFCRNALENEATSEYPT